MTSPLLALVLDSSTLEWADLGAAFAVFLAYLGLCAIWPGTMLRPLFWVLTRTFWRLRVYGREHLPKSGPVLLISNHVTFIDWMFLWIACPRRVRFLAAASHSRNPFVRLFLRMAQTIPIEDKQIGPRGLTAAFQAAADAMMRGEIVCIFAEGQLTRNGEMLPFHRGFERILALVPEPVPIIPVCLLNLWGSIFSYRHGKVFWKWPERCPYPVGVSFGPALPATSTASEVKHAVQRAWAEGAIRESERLPLVHRQFARRAARHPFRKCVIDTSGPKPRIMSYGKTFAGAMCLRDWLKPRLGEERFIGVWLPTSLGAMLTNIALALLGRTSVNLNYTAGMDAVHSAIRQSGIRIVLTSKRFTQRIPIEVPEGVQLVYLEDAQPHITKGKQIRAFLAVLLLPGWFLDRVWLGLGRHRMNDIATVIFSSGSTGEPKGVMLNHRNLAANIHSLVQAVELDQRDCLHSVLPFFHSFGYTITLWGPAQVGASGLYHPDPRQAKEIGEQCRTFHTTILLSTATFLRFYLRRCEPTDFRSLRLLVCGAEKLPPSLAREFDEKFGLFPLEGYGCTELSPVVSVNLPDREIHGLKQIANKVGSIGQPIPGVAGRIVHPESGEELPLGSEGMLEVKGANVMAGYLGKPELTARVIRDGWYTTGDMGRIDEDGFITLTGRLSRFAKIGGEMVPLERIEEELHHQLGTADRMLAVTAVPDDKRGERLIVLYLETMVVPPRELCEKLSHCNLPNLWQPDHRDFHQVHELPVLGSGKLDIRAVQELARQLTAKG